MQDESRRVQIASTRHFVMFLIIAAAVTALGCLAHLRHTIGGPSVPHNRIAIYLSMAAFDWLLMFFCWRGLRRPETIASLIGGRWPSVLHVVKDVAISVGFWLVANTAIFVTMSHLGTSPGTEEMKALAAVMPHTPPEVAAWCAVSFSAGFCEEFVFRGYVQRQLRAFTGSVAVAIIGQAAVFAAMHAYQGLKPLAMVGALGLAFGILAAWRRSLRPGMIAHAWQDIWGGWLMGLLLR